MEFTCSPLHSLSKDRTIIKQKILFILQLYKLETKKMYKYDIIKGKIPEVSSLFLTRTGTSTLKLNL